MPVDDPARAELPIPAAAGWRPMPFRNVDARRIRDPLFEPMWAGRRTLAHIRAGVVGLTDERGDERPGFAALRTALRTALAASLRADEAVLDGYLLPGRLPDGTGRESHVGMAAVMSAGEMSRQLLVGSRRSTDERRAADAATAARRVMLDPDAETSFIAIDLVWLDGQALLEIPLAERKRLLESVLDEGDIVRRTVAVREPVEVWFAQWRALGFQEYAVKASNSRYAPGPEGEGWATALIPKR